MEELENRRAGFRKGAAPLLERVKILRGEVSQYMRTFQDFRRQLYDFIPESDIVETQTDADGDFEIAVPPVVGAALYAKAVREVGGQRQSYHWFFRLSEPDFQGKLLLSNQNVARVQTS